MITVYGLKNCDTCRKALKWLAGQDIDHHFHDVRNDGLDAKRIAGWIDAAGLEKLVNRRSTTWRNLSEVERDQATGDKAADFLAANATLIKRPVIDIDGDIQVGFNAAVEAALATAKSIA
jgi:Spx/MgsR family transcriptional regulator